MSTLTYSHKRGDTFSLAGPVTGLPSGVTIARCQLRNPQGNLVVAELAVTLDPETSVPRMILLEASATLTASWPIAKLNSDIEFDEPGGIVISSPTFVVDVVQDITLPP